MPCKSFSFLEHTPCSTCLPVFHSSCAPQSRREFSLGGGAVQYCFLPFLRLLLCVLLETPALCKVILAYIGHPPRTVLSHFRFNAQESRSNRSSSNDSHNAFPRGPNALRAIRQNVTGEASCHNKLSWAALFWPSSLLIPLHSSVFRVDKGRGADTVYSKTKPASAKPGICFLSRL